ncbi:MAG TPA: cold shock domain-containing protein [Anaerolineae bacterium]|nr:cold shock domain-containing protein [Anaerolineae bacterium]
MRQDQFLYCASCTTQFLWTPDEQQQDELAPDRCPACRHLLPVAGRQRGVVKFYSLRKHWGFITQPDGVEVFFHRSALAPGEELPPSEGELVEYAVEPSPRGPQAIDLRRLSLASG